jgi:DNA-binding response OmpR family regulator
MEEQKIHLLLVDDEPDLVQMVSVRLKAAGYEVSTAYDGQEALEKVRKAQPDLMILDLMLPKLDGYKVCRLLKFDEKTRAMPILIFTARAQVEDVTLATECGADAYLTKPFEAKALLAKIQELLVAAGKVPL